MKKMELIGRSGPFEEWRVSLTARERRERVDARTFRALCVLEGLRARYGVVVAVLAAIPLAIWTDCAKPS